MKKKKRNKNNKNEEKNSKREEKEKESENDNKNKDNNKKEEINSKTKFQNKKTEKEKYETIISTSENKDFSNKNTEVVMSDNKKLNLHKQYYEGVTLMKGVEDFIAEDLNEDEVYNLVEQAIYSIKEKEETSKISKEQTKAIASILYKKIHKKGINMKDYPELKGIKVQIGIEKLTKEIIRKMMFNDIKVDECHIDLTYANLTLENDDIKVLTIEIVE